MQLQLQPRYITQRCARLITLHDARTTIATATATTLQLTLRYTTLHYTTLHYTTLHDIKLHYTTLITPHHDYNCNCTCNYTDYTTLQLQLHYTTLQLRLQLQLQHLQLQLHYTTPVGPSVDSLCHPWFTTTNLSYEFPIFETSATALCGTTGTCKAATIPFRNLDRDMSLLL